MSHFNESENHDPRTGRFGLVGNSAADFGIGSISNKNEVYGSNSRENLSHVQLNPSISKKYQRSLLNPSSGKAQAITIPTSRVPMIRSTNSNGKRDPMKYLIRNELGKDKYEIGVLNKVTPYKLITPSSSVKNSSLPVVPLGNTPHSDPSIDITQSQSKKLKDLNNVSSSSPSPSPLSSPKVLEANDGVIQNDSSNGITSNEYYLSKDLNDPRISYLNPYKPFVEVFPPKLGSHLAKNGSPLDLSSVSKNSSASPLFGFEDPEYMKMTKDEEKLLSILNYEFSLPNGPLNWKGEKVGEYAHNAENNRDFEADSDSNESNSNGWFNGWFNDFANKLIRLSPFTGQSKMYQKFPWAKIIYDIDHSDDIEAQMNVKSNNELDLDQYGAAMNSNQNLDMIPIRFQGTSLDEFAKNYSDIKRQKHTFIQAA